MWQTVQPRSRRRLCVRHQEQADQCKNRYPCDRSTWQGCQIQNMRVAYEFPLFVSMTGLLLTTRFSPSDTQALIPPLLHLAPARRLDVQILGIRGSLRGAVALLTRSAPTVRAPGLLIEGPQSLPFTASRALLRHASIVAQTRNPKIESRRLLGEVRSKLGLR